MGKKAEDFDGQIVPIRIAYLKSSQYGDWELCTHYVQMMNSCINKKFRIANLKPFNHKAKTLSGELILKTEARNWCLRFEPLVESAITRERDFLLSSME